MEPEITTNVHVLDKAFKIIDVLAPENGLNVSQIVSKTGINRTTVYRLLESLRAHGYVEKMDSALYGIGMKAVALAGYYVNKLELITVAQPLLWNLAKKLNLSVFMAVLDGTDIMYIARADINENSSIYNEIGARAPAYSTAMGKCLLAQLSSEALGVIMENAEYQKVTTRTINDFPTLKQVLHEVRKKGYAIDDQEFAEDKRCVAAPVYNFCGEGITSVCVSGTCAQLPLEGCDAIAEVVMETAGNISRKLGYSP